MSAGPPLSIIVTSRHSDDRLQTTLESIRAQRSPQLETLVVNLAPGTGANPAIEANRGSFSHVLTAAPDGAVAAVNEAIDRAAGDWVLLLGGSDRLVGEAVLSETLNWMKKTEAGVVAGESASDDGRIVRLHSRVNPIAGNFTPRAATFYRRTLFAENGGFDTSLHAMGEYEFNVRLWKNRVRFKPIPIRIAACTTVDHPLDWRACREEIRVRHRYFPIWRSWPWDALSLLRCTPPRMARQRI